MDPGPRETIMRLGHVFQRICAKVIDPNTLDDLQEYTVETMCLMEKWFPPSFWDISPHLLVHLVPQLQLCSPVHTRWCSGLERYLYVLKKQVRNKSKPEGSMAVGYAYDDALGFCTKYLQDFEHTSRRTWDADKEDRDTKEVLEGSGTDVVFSDSELFNIHDYVIHNEECTSELL
jgi:hypothetical protein